MKNWYSKIVILALLTLLTVGVANARPVLRVLAWPGYADPDIVATFEQRTGADVQVSFVTSDQELWDRVSAHGGSDFDLFAVNTAELQRYIQAGLVSPVELREIPNHEQQLPRFREFSRIPGLVHDGRVYAVPYTYSEMGIIFDPAQVEQPPDSLSALWDPAYRRRVLAFDTGNHNFSLAAMALGFANPFRLSDAEFYKAAESLVALRRNALTFYRSPDEVVQLYMKHPVAVMFANYGSQQVKLLREAGINVDYAIPREGALAWLDCWAVTRGAKNPELAAQWIDYMLERPVSEALTERQGLANTVTPNPRTHDDDLIIWLQPLEDNARRDRLWEKILSGDVPQKLLTEGANKI
ncbi:MAG: extracellular solute-binding protein [Sedimenticolaceae bacterium]